MQIKCKRENLTDFLILHLSMVITTTVFWLNSSLEKHSGTSLWPTKLYYEETLSFQLNIDEKKIGVNETASPESVFKMGYLGHFWATFWTWNGSKSVEIGTQSSLALIFPCMMKPISSFLAYYQLRILVFSICGTVFPKNENLESQNMSLLRRLRFVYGWIRNWLSLYLQHK